MSRSGARKVGYEGIRLHGIDAPESAVRRASHDSLPRHRRSGVGAALSRRRRDRPVGGLRALVHGHEPVKPGRVRANRWDFAIGTGIARLKRLTLVEVNAPEVTSSRASLPSLVSIALVDAMWFAVVHSPACPAVARHARSTATVPHAPHPRSALAPAPRGGDGRSSHRASAPVVRSSRVCAMDKGRLTLFSSARAAVVYAPRKRLAARRSSMHLRYFQARPRKLNNPPS